MLEDLLFLEQQVPQGFVGDVLHAAVGIDGEGGGGSCGVADHHEDGLHSNAAISGVGGGEAAYDEEVFAFAGFGAEGAVADGEGFEAANVEAAFAVKDAGVVDVKGDAVGVERVGGEGDAVLGVASAFGVVLGDDVVADHAAGFADVDLMGPVAGVGELIFGEAPALHFGADFDGQAFVMTEEPEQAEGVVFVVLEKLLALGVVALGPFVAEAVDVAAEFAAVV